MVNKKVLGKMKDECSRFPIAEYVGLCPKMYSILEASGKSIKKAKGVKKNTVMKHIRHEQYKEALFEKPTFRHVMDVVQSERHHIYGQRLNKVSLSPFDSKRWIAEHVVDTLAYEHKDATPASWALQRYALGKTPSGGSCVSGGTRRSSSRTNPRWVPSCK